MINVAFLELSTFYHTKVSKFGDDKSSYYFGKLLKILQD